MLPRPPADPASRGVARPAGRRPASARRLLRRLRLRVTHPARGLAALRARLRRGELGLLVLAIAAGVASGVLARLLGGAVGQLHILLFGEGAEHG